MHIPMKGRNPSIEFIPRDELNDNYVVYASFYNVHLREAYIESLRNVPDIFSTSGTPSENEINNDNPDALFILLNHGSATPVDENYSIPTFDEDTS